jgi:hypothetical protein
VESELFCGKLWRCAVICFKAVHLTTATSHLDFKAGLRRYSLHPRPEETGLYGIFGKNRIILTILRTLRDLRILFGGIMLEVTASQFVKHVGEYKEKVQRQPIAITSHGRTSGYFISQHEYHEYVKLKTQSRQVYGLDDLPATTIESTI